MTGSIGIEPPFDALEKITPIFVRFCGMDFVNNLIQKRYTVFPIMLEIHRALLD